MDPPCGIFEPTANHRVSPGLSITDDDDSNLFKEKLMARIPKMSTPLGIIPFPDFQSLLPTFREALLKQATLISKPETRVPAQLQKSTREGHREGKAVH